MESSVFNFPQLNFPKYNLKLHKNSRNQWVVNDSFRNKKLILTPEEWVRQNLLQFLIHDRAFPKGLISLEAGLTINKNQRRYDALVFDRYGKSLVLIECKSPEVNINQNTFDQISAYNLTIKAPYLLITNGLRHFFCKLDEIGEQFNFLTDIPVYSSL